MFGVDDANNVTQDLLISEEVLAKAFTGYVFHIICIFRYGVAMSFTREDNLVMAIRRIGTSMLARYHFSGYTNRDFHTAGIG